MNTKSLKSKVSRFSIFALVATAGFQFSLPAVAKSSTKAIPLSTNFIQNKEEIIKGKVTDTKGEALPGAVVSIQGKKAASSTNAEGFFTIRAAIGDILEIKLMGFKINRYKIISSNQPIVIKLQTDETKLDEIVIMGYGETKRRNLTSAQTTISAKDIERTVNTTFDQALQGRSAGVMVTTNSAQPGGGISVNIRGLGSIGGTTEPLYVIDGVQLQPELSGFNNSSSMNPLASMNPSDIETMEVLQGPSATAIYGSRATNGVVLITTKRGKSGDAKITFDVLYTQQGKPAELGLLNLQEYVTINNYIRKILNQPIAPSWQDPSLLGEGTDWQSVIFKSAPLVKNQLSISGGNDKTTFYLSAERFSQTGVVSGSGFDRTGIRLNLDNTARTWLKLSANISASQTFDNLGTTVTQGIRNAFTMPPYITPRNTDGSYGGYPSDEATYRQEDLNPVALAELKTHTQKRNVLNGGATATIYLLPGLQFRTNINASLNNTNSTDFNPTWKIGAVSNDKAALVKASSEGFYWNWNQLLEFKKKIFTNHDITLMVSHEAQESTYEGLTGSRYGFPANRLPGGQLPSIALGDEIGSRNGGWKGWWAQESYLGRAIYNYKDRYIANFTYRGDGSVNFGENNKWGFFPSFSLAWRISDEPFFKNNIKIFDDFKLRYETGLTGNQGSGGIYAPLRPVASPWGNGYIVNSYKNPDLKWEETSTHNLGFNLALFNNRISLEGDFYVRNTDNLIMRNPLPFYMGTDGAGKIDAPFVNIGALKNKGWSLTLNTVNIHTKNLKWSTNFNISHNVATVMKFYQETAVVDMTNWNAGGGFIQRSAVGQKAWQFWGYKSAGIFQSVDDVNNSAVPQNGVNPVRIQTGYTGIWLGDYKYVDLNHNGLINPLDMTYIGDPYPKVTLGFTNDVSYKGFNISMLITGSIGNKIYNAFRYGYINPSRVYTYQNALKEALNFARIGFDDINEPYLINPDATVARYGGSNGNRASDAFVEDGSYLRIKNLTLSYQIPAKILNRTKVLQGVRLGVGVQNLYTLTKYKGYDPEIGVDVGHESDINRRTFGVDVGQYPQVRSFTFNASINF